MSIVTSLASTSLTYNQYGVPAIGQTTGLGILMPKLKQRYRATFAGGAFSTTGIGVTTMTQNMVTCTRPQQSFDSTELHSYNNIVYIPQKPKWEPIEITLRDDISNNVTSLVSAQRSMQMNSYSQSAAPAGSNFKFAIQIDILDGTMASDNTIESFVLLGCYIMNTNYDGLDFASSEPVIITLSIRYDDALQGDEIGLQNLISPLASNPSQVLAG
jgi:hypothetical protein